MRIFVNNVSLEIAQLQQGSTPSGEVATFATPSTSQIMQFYDLARGGQIRGTKDLLFEVSNYEEAVKAFKERFSLVEAAGGIVEKNGKVLFICRLGKWDLPKGKIEKGESPEEASVREVEEECGVKAKLLKHIGDTWHTYPDRNGGDVLKKTYWYAMQCLDDSKMTPQLEEQITDIRWITIDSQKQVSDVMSNTYSSIRHIFQAYMGR
jgi:8-oxo-dGTP pyrophosphatase MutT (NUDIX family)